MQIHTEQSSGEKVYLYVYDLSRGLARSLSPSLIGRQIDGVWHTSIVCYGYEIFYGQGIFITDRVGQTHYGTPVEIRDMGVTEIPQEVFVEYIDSLRGLYTAERYHLLEHNCNTFTNDVCQFLVGKTIPEHITNLPEDFLNTPLGQSLRPMIDGAFSGPPPQPFAQHTVSSALTPPPPQPLATTIKLPQFQQTIRFPTTIAELDSVISSSQMAVAFFTSETCGPCKMIEPHYHSLSKTHTNISFIQIDTHKAFALARQQQITATPTFKTYLNGKLYAEWKGGNPTILDSNLTQLVEAAKPPLPPNLRGHYSQSPILFSRPPPMDKVLPKLPPGAFPRPLLSSISTFLSAKGNVEVLVPPLVNWANCQKELDYNLENAWVVVDLLRVAIADRRVSGWFAIDGIDTISDIVKKVTARDDAEWQLRIVTVQLIANMFSTPLLTMASLRPFLPELIDLLTTSVLADPTTSTMKLVKGASSALFNLSRICIEESVAPNEDETISIVVALVESLKKLLEKDISGNKDLQTLLVVCIGGFVMLGRRSNTVKEVLEGIEATEIIAKVEGETPREIIEIIKTP